ncbi:MAG TPA: type II restriction endonuclease [Acetivibrio sp.]|uniref:type II restriction endonuclease n=1 Tax=Acetivibrio sp. TaxID=1872092 RepID=UPI002CC849B9|nr:type II restriction endonuclease [Acetivibrio sp.]HOM03100.1 type II restriction endonuclease [Acetivibrio sp.]
MKYSDIFKSRLGCNNADEVFEYLLQHMKETIKGWDFFVAWEKVMNKVGSVEVVLNILNYLVGKENIVEEFKMLIGRYPEIAEILPILLALREKSIKVLDPLEDNVFNYKEYVFRKKKKYSPDEIEMLAEFAKKTGLLSMFEKKNIKSVVDYVIGVEVGLDTNARKNRSGTAMEMITELFIKKICSTNNYRYLPQATSHKIKASFEYDVSVDKSERSFDFAIDNGQKLYLVETNYYGGGGSKLKSVAGEFSTLFNFIKNETPEHGFIWITDGKGWETAQKPLRESFDKVDYILNLDMVQKGILEDIISQGL